MDKIICPNCKKRPMHINHTFNSFPNYVCASYGEGYGSCSHVISVHEYEAKYQDEMSRLERISKKFNAGVYRFYTDDGREDMAFLIGELQRLSEKE